MLDNFMLGLGVLSGTIVGLIFIIPVVNYFLSIILGKYKMKWFTPKRFKTKKDPIYKLNKGEYESYYSITKYELGWLPVSDYPILSIPFSGLFFFYGYVPSPKRLGTFSEKEIKEGKVDNLAEVYERLYKTKYTMELMEKSSEEAWEAKLNQINKEFNENYE